MLDIVNSLVKDIANTAGNAAGSLTDYQGKTYDPNTILALSKQIAGSIDPNAIKGGVFTTKGQSIGFNYDESTKLLGHPPTATEQVVLDMARHLAKEGVTDLNNVDATDTNRRFGSTYTGGGGTIYEIKKDADGKPVISSWSKDTSDKKAIISGLALAAAAFGIPGVTEGLLSNAPAGATLGTVGTGAAGTSTLGSLASGGTGLIEGSSLSGLTGGSSLSGLTGGTLGATNALLGDAALGSTLAGASTLPIGTTLANLGAAGAGGSLLNAGAGAGAASALGTTLGQGLALNALGTGLGAIANQSGISNARDAITQGGANANTALNTAYNDARNLNTAGRTDLANNYANLNTNLNNTLAGQSGIYNATNTNLANNYQNLNTNLNNALNAQAGVYNQTGTNLANNYQNLNTNLNNTINAQAGAYNLANQNINQNAQTQLGLLGSTYQGQKDQAAANAAALNANYNTTLGKMGDVYNQQV